MTDPRRQPVQARSRERVASILAAAARLIAEKGSVALRINELARAADVPIGSIYQYFPNKSAILAALADHYFQGLGAMVRTVLASVSDRESLANAVYQFLWNGFYLAHDVPIFRDLWSGTEADRAIEHVNVQDSLRNARDLAAVMARVMPERGDAESVLPEALATVHLCGAAARLALSVDEPLGIAMYDRHVRMVMAGLDLPHPPIDGPAPHSILQQTYFDFPAPR